MRSLIGKLDVLEGYLIGINEEESAGVVREATQELVQLQDDVERLEAFLDLPGEIRREPSPGVDGEDG